VKKGELSSSEAKQSSIRLTTS